MDTRATSYSSHSSEEQVMVSFIDQVVEAAMENFVPGKQYQEELMATDVWKEDYNFMFRYLTKKDETILNGYNAARIPNTNFTAAAGPHSEDEMEGFIKNTVDHPDAPIFQVVALGSLAVCQEISYRHDFFDYGLVERTINCDSYVATIKRKSGEVSSTKNKQYMPDNIIESELHVRNKKTLETKVLKVCVIACGDGNPILLEANSPHKDYFDDDDNIFLTETAIALRKEALWKLYQEYLKNPMLVHCSAGIGRTGEFILMMEIAKHYDEIFASDDPQLCAQKIHDILANMRSIRPAMIFYDGQFKSAIKNADILYHYVLELKVRQKRDAIPGLNEDVVEDKKLNSVISSTCRFTLFKTNPVNSEKKSESLNHTLHAPQDSEMNREAQTGIKRKRDDDTDNTSIKKIRF